jgi:hypothetical protein
VSAREIHNINLFRRGTQVGRNGVSKYISKMDDACSGRNI